MKTKTLMKNIKYGQLSWNWGVITIILAVYIYELKNICYHIVEMVLEYDKYCENVRKISFEKACYMTEKVE